MQTVHENGSHKSKATFEVPRTGWNFLQLELTILFGHNFHGLTLLFVYFCLFFLLIRRVLKLRGVVCVCTCVCMHNMREYLHWETKLASVMYWNSFSKSFSPAPKNSVYVSVCYLWSLPVFLLESYMSGLRRPNFLSIPSDLQSCFVVVSAN